MDKININICYVDDTLDLKISKFIDDYCGAFVQTIGTDDVSINYDEYQFDPEQDSYETLLKTDKINLSNVLLIDSRLFTNSDISTSAQLKNKYKGEQFKVLLKNTKPYIRTIVISQNAEEANVHFTVPKLYNSGDPQEHYDTHLKPLLDKCIHEIIYEFKTLNEIDQNKDLIDPMLLSSVHASISGREKSSILEKKDVDKLIDLFVEVKAHYDSK